MKFTKDIFISLFSYAVLLLYVVLKPTNLNPRFGETNPKSQFLPHKNIGVVSFGETSLQFVQLGGREPGPVSLLFRGFVPVPHPVLTPAV